MFILRQKLFIAVVALAGLAAATLLVAMARRNGHGAPADVATMALIGLVCGVGFAVLTVLPGFFLYRALATPTPRLSLAPGERVLFAAIANHFLDGEGRGGRLFVTERRLGFVPHKYNVQLAGWSAPWAGIAGFATPDSAVVGVVAAAVGVPGRPLQNFLTVRLGDGRDVRLVVAHRERVAEYLEQVRAAGDDARAATAERARAALALASVEVPTRE
ncbi:MAG TPA: hypothetical protein VF997_12725 [Polyangia bacterium]